MNELPEFWRTEIWHALVVHFPVALLSLATLLTVVLLFVKKNEWLLSRNLLLLLGTLGAWAAVYTGGMADGIVSRKICDPTVLKQHENLGLGVAYTFTAASFLLMVLRMNWFEKFRNYIKILLIAVILAGGGLLAYTGHLGATLVYQQGAGVYQPSENCEEFN